MALKPVIESLDDVDDKYQDLYEENDKGEFVLVVEDSDFKAKINEFRTNNTDLKKQIEDAQKQMESFKDVDPAKYKAMQEELLTYKDKTLLDEGKVDELLEKRTERMRSEYTDKFSKLETIAAESQRNAEKYQLQLSKIAVNDAVMKGIASSKALVRAGAAEDLLSRASRVWSVDEDGNIRAKDPSSGNIIYGMDGKAPLTTEEWVIGLHKDAPFLFEASKGGGAGGSGNDGGDPNKISSHDKEAFSANLEAIAKGDVKVV